MYCDNHFLPLIRAGQFKRIAYCSSAAGSITVSLYVFLSLSIISCLRAADCTLTRRPCLTHPPSNATRPGDLASYGVSRAAAGSYFVRLAGELKGKGVHIALYTPCVPSCSNQP